MFRESTQIIKQHGKSCFVDVRADFCLGEGKVCFHFRSLNQQNKVIGIIDCYLSIEEFQLIAHMFKTGSIFGYIRSKGRYVSYGGKKNPSDGSIISRQLRIEGDESGLYIKALQGPGKMSNQGGYAPAYKDNEAMTIVIKVDVYQAQMMGFAFQRAIDYYDAWNQAGVLKERMEALQWKKDDGNKAADISHSNSIAAYPHQIPVQQPPVDMWQQAPQNIMPQPNQLPEAYF